MFGNEELITEYETQISQKNSRKCMHTSLFTQNQACIALNKETSIFSIDFLKFNAVSYTSELYVALENKGRYNSKHIMVSQGI